MEPHTFALPFVLKRSNDVITGSRITSTTEHIHGLLRIDAAELIVQWRVTRATDYVGAEIRTEQEYEPVREVAIPLNSVAGAAVRHRAWAWFTLKPQIVLTASDLRAFEEITGAAGLKLDHPATLTLLVPRQSRLAAIEFAAELNLILAEGAAGTLLDQANARQRDRSLPSSRKASMSEPPRPGEPEA